MKRRLFLTTSLLGASGLLMKSFSNNSLLPADTVKASTPQRITQGWKFVSMPDFVNRDVPWPEPKLDGILDFILEKVKEEDPEFLMVMGDLVNGRWWMLEDITLTGTNKIDPALPDKKTLAFHRKHVLKMAKLYHKGWVNRMKAHDLPFYVGVGDHELGDDPWIGLKKPLVKDFENAFRKYYQMPLNGPAGKKGLAYSVIRDNCLLIVIDPFEQEENGDVSLKVSQEQLDWMEQILIETKDSVKFRIVGTHTPVLTKGIQANASSKLTLPGETQAPLWQIMKKHDVDLFLCGEYHAISCQESDGILQVVHGALMGFSQQMNFLVVKVTPDALHLEFKEIETVFEKPAGEPDRLSRIARISDAQLKRNPESVGTMRIDKSSGNKNFTDRTGVFTTKYNIYNNESPE